MPNQETLDLYKEVDELEAKLEAATKALRVIRDHGCTNSDGTPEDPPCYEVDRWARDTGIWCSSCQARAELDNANKRIDEERRKRAEVELELRIFKSVPQSVMCAEHANGNVLVECGYGAALLDLVRTILRDQTIQFDEIGDRGIEANNVVHSMIDSMDEEKA